MRHVETIEEAASLQAQDSGDGVGWGEVGH